MPNIVVLTTHQPILKEPEYVEVYGVTQSFDASVFKCTEEKELATFHKSAKSGGMSMAESTSQATSSSTSIKSTGIFHGVTSESTSGTSSAEELARSKMWESDTTNEEEEKIKKAFLTEYVKMPMRCVRIPYDSMRLSEDAKIEISKIVTLREAHRFLRTFGSHLSCGEYTLGGVFFRTIAMESEEKVSSVTIYSAAGNTMSHEVSHSKTKTKSGGASFGIFGLGPKMSKSSTSTSAEKEGESSNEEESNNLGTKTASNFYSYSVTVSSLGPNASSPEEFFTALNTNTGTWSVIDKGALDHVIPIWDLIRDELLDNDRTEEEHAQISKACRLLKKLG